LAQIAVQDSDFTAAAQQIAASVHDIFLRIIDDCSHMID
jgi:hypothetical protein